MGVQRPAAADVDTGLAGLAIFDLDRTVYPGSSLRLLADELRARGVVRWGDFLRVVGGDLAFRRTGAGDGIAPLICARALGVARGLEAEPLRQIAEKVADVIVRDARPAVLAAVERHLSSGSFCVLLSASPQEVVEAVARRLGVHRGVGTVTEVFNGCLTGFLVGPLCHGEGKLVRFTEAIGQVDLSDAWAYADSDSDLPLLSSCGHPVAVFPSRQLRRVAQQRGWEILDGRGPPVRGERSRTGC